MAKLSLQCDEELMREDVKPLLERLITHADPEFLAQHHIPHAFVVQKERHFYMTFIRQLLEHNGYAPDEREQFWSEFFGSPDNDDIYEMFRRAIVTRGTKRDVAASCPSIHLDNVNDMLHRIPPRYGTWKNIAKDLDLPVDTFGPWAKAYFEYLRDTKQRNEFGARMGTLFAMQEGAVHSRWMEQRPTALPREYITNTELSRLVARLQKGERPQSWELTDRVVHALGCGDPEWRLLTAQAWLKTTLANEGHVAPTVIRKSSLSEGRPVTPKPKTERPYDPGLPYPESLAGQNDETIIAACATAFAQHVGLEDYALEGEPASAIDELIEKSKARKKKPTAVPMPETDKFPAPDIAETVEIPAPEPAEAPASSAPVDVEASPAERADASIDAFDYLAVPSFVALPKNVDAHSLTDVQIIHIVDSIDQAVDDIHRQSGCVSIRTAREAVFARTGISEEEFSVLWRHYDEAKKNVSKQESKWIAKWFEKYPDDHRRLAYVFGKAREHGKLNEKQLSRAWVQFFDLDPSDPEAAHLFMVLERQRGESEAVLNVLFERMREAFEEFIERGPEPWMFDWLMSHSVIGRHFEPITEAVKGGEGDVSVFDFTEPMKFSIFQELWSRLDDPAKAIDEANDVDFGRKQIVLAGTHMGMTIIARRVSLGLPACAIDITRGVGLPALPNAQESAYDPEAAAESVDEKFATIVAAISFKETDDSTLDGAEVDAGENESDHEKNEDEGKEKRDDSPSTSESKQVKNKRVKTAPARPLASKPPAQPAPPVAPKPTPASASVPSSPAQADTPQPDFSPEYMQELEARLRREGRIL